MDNDNEKDVDLDFEEFNDGEATSKDKIKDLREKLKSCQKEKEDYLNGWQRERADFANYKKGEDERKSVLFSAMQERILGDFLKVSDSFDMAFANKEAWEKVDPNWRTGVEYIYSQLNAVFEDYGMKPVGEVGEEFNPEIHQSVETEATDKQEDDHKISAVIQKGYKLGDRLVRPAKVKVWAFK